MTAKDGTMFRVPELGEIPDSITKEEVSSIQTLLLKSAFDAFCSSHDRAVVIAFYDGVVSGTIDGLLGTRSDPSFVLAYKTLAAKLRDKIPKV